jgi:hypothetical protein
MRVTQPAHERLNSHDRSLDRLVFPHPDDPPSGLAEDIVVSRIALNVACNLGIPISPVRLRAQAMAGAPMPKTTIHEDRNPLTGKNDIRPAP